MSEKPPCYGHYFEECPTVTVLKRRGCVICRYWTYDKDSCPLVSATKVSLAIHEICFLSGLLEKRLKEEPDCKIAKTLIARLREALPEFIVKMLDR